jgi:drug/metabolite transporter (DMT)-like permease
MKNKGHAQGIMWIVLAGLMFVAVTVLVRHLGSDLPAVQAAFIRYGFGLLLVSTWHGCDALVFCNGKNSHC